MVVSGEERGDLKSPENGRIELTMVKHDSREKA